MALILIHFQKPRLMKKTANIFFLITLMAAVLSSCQKEEDTCLLDRAILAEWHLTSMEVNGTSVSQTNLPEVYIEFREDNTFVQYQKSGDQLRFYIYTGECRMNGNLLTGHYSDGSPLSSEWNVSWEGKESVLVLKSRNGAEINRLVKESLSPEEKANATPWTRTSQESDERFL